MSSLLQETLVLEVRTAPCSNQTLKAQKNKDTWLTVPPSEASTAGLQRQGIPKGTDLSPDYAGPGVIQCEDEHSDLNPQSFWALADLQA